ncbi:MAG: Cas10/Cmr2 second palm domain-containing protein, partial [Planktothrix sp.]
LETPSRSISGEDEQLVEGKFLDPHERLSIPELVKRLITRYEIRRSFEQIPALKRFTDLERKPDPEQNHSGQWTGWFMGDGDKVGKKLKEIADQSGDHGLQSFSKSMRTWGRDFMQKFPSDLGRVIYAGGDDFLGVIYSKNPNQPIPPQRALKWLMELNNEWKTHKQEITLSVGFVWAGHSVPQRDVLQHCREAEKQAKSLGRDRVTLRIVFNSGQSVQWTCPWEHLSLLNQYRDRNGGQNWSQVYSDLAQLKARHSIEPKSKNPDYKLALALMNIYFQNSGEMIL